MHLLSTQVNEHETALARWAPSILITIGLLAAWMLWGAWGVALEAACLGLLLWRGL